MVFFLYCVLRWVPFEVAKPLLDKKPYSVLSNYTKVSPSSSSPPPPPQASETLAESVSEHEDTKQEDANGDKEMYNSDEDEDEDSGRNRSDITNIPISLDGRRLRYKVISNITVITTLSCFFSDN